MGFREFLNESGNVVFVNDGGEPSQKVMAYVEDGVKKFNGEIEEVTDKGPYFRFNNRTDASNFIKYIGKYRGEYIHAEFE